MPIPAAGLGYLRLLLRAETDGILMAAKRPAALTISVPETDEFRTLLELVAAQSGPKVGIAGDDPLLRQDIDQIVAMVAELPGIGDVAMTTCGLGLAGRVESLAQAGLRGINVDLDTLKPQRYRRGEGRKAFAKVWHGLEEAVSAGLRVKLNTVLERGYNDDEVDDFVKLTEEWPIEVRFVEWNVGIDHVAPPDAFVPTWEAMASIQPPLVPHDSREDGGPAIVLTVPGHKGAIGFIPNLTEHLCNNCERIGLTDSGEIVSCVFGHGLDLLRHLRGPGGAGSVTAFVDRVMRRKSSLAAKLGAWESPTVSATAAR
ncbi:MAG: radical SAM protein [Candidatus Eisenbacteria sp.]|nr:radical SAM protein [Candidatus Eisenbacteria bacterium]